MKGDHSTYSSAEQELKQHGYVFEGGMPLHGVRFSNKDSYAFLLRITDDCYQIYVYNKQIENKLDADYKLAYNYLKSFYELVEKNGKIELDKNHHYWPILKELFKQ